MIDIHTHILPGIDDGAVDWAASLEMAKAAAAEGITGLIATPHHANGRYDNPASIVEQLVQELQGRLQEASVPLTIYSGQEVRVHTNLLEAVEMKELLTLAKSNYILLEMPTSSIPERMSEWVYELRHAGIKPIIAHPERNSEVVQHPERFKALIEEGAYGQVTTHSLLGAFGKKIESRAWEMCSEGAIHFVSSDAHNLQVRGFRLREAYEKIYEKLGQEFATLCQNNASSILKNGEIAAFERIVTESTSNWKKFRKLFAFR